MSDRPREPVSEPDEDQPIPEEDEGEDEGEEESDPHIPSERNLPGGQPIGPG